MPGDNARRLATSQHSRHDGVTHVEGAGQVDRQHVIPNILCQLGEGFPLTLAGVVDEEVDRAQFCIHCSNCLVHCLVIAHVDDVSACLVAKGAQRLGSRLQQFLADLKPDNFAAFTSQREGHLLAQPLASASDERPLST